MDYIKFAVLIAYISYKSSCHFDKYDIEEIKRLVEDLFPPPDTLLERESYCYYDMEVLFRAMADGRKIDAIKQYRKMTNVDLKDAKDMVEMITNKFHRHEPLAN